MIAAALLTLCAPSVAVDGDTIKDCNGKLWRLARIDAPETHGCRKGRRCAPGDGKASKAALARMIRGRAVRCRIVDALPDRPGFQSRDPYGRPVVRCWAGGVELGPAMLRGGWAVRWPIER
ncbi:thermonuclease family protein [Stakelama pacifica]|nr:thermonuclease family protein [Stakelama pacifica]